MGGTPKTALNLVCYPDDKEPLDWLGDILAGSLERCQAAGVVIVGGHTVRDAEIKYGLAVTGMVHPHASAPMPAAKPGDLLVLTKALGTGFVTTAHRADACPDEVFKTACASMIQLNDIGRDAMLAAVPMPPRTSPVWPGRSRFRDGRRQPGDVGHRHGPLAALARQRASGASRI